MKNYLIHGLLVFGIISTCLADTNANIENNKPLEVRKSQIKKTCYTDRIEKIVNKIDNTTRELITSGKTSESLNTVWASDDIEYHFIDTKGFRNNGKDLYLEMKSIIKTKIKKEGHKLFESSKVTEVKNYISDLPISTQNPIQRDYDLELVFQVYGNEQVLIKAVTNGIETPTNGFRMIETKLNETQTRVLITHSTPYTLEDGDFKTELIKNDLICLHEEIK